MLLRHGLIRAVKTVQNHFSEEGEADFSGDGDVLFRLPVNVIDLISHAVSGDITLGNHATITHFGPNTTRAHAVVLRAGGDITIAAGASVNVEQKGYAFVTKKMVMVPAWAATTAATAARRDQEPMP